MYEAIVFLVDGFEEIEAMTVIDVLRRGGVKTASVSLTGSRNVVGSKNTITIADMILDGLNTIDGSILILPGGPGTSNYKNHEIFLELLCMHYNEGGHIAAICAAPTILGKLGFLSDKTAVCYPILKHELNCRQFGDDNVVTDGNITTSKGPATSIEFSLEILRLIKGLSAATEVSSALLYAG